jgi:hypothetical protein
MKDEGGRMKDEMKAVKPFFHPSSFILSKTTLWLSPTR